MTTTNTTDTKKVEFFMIRPYGQHKGVFALTRQDAALFLSSLIHEADVEEKASKEDFGDEADIISASPFSNGVLVKIECREWVAKAIVRDNDFCLRDLSIDGQRIF